MYTLMIVDDEPLARDVIKTIINENLKDVSVVYEAVNGRQAVEYYVKNKPDIILMDIRIPGINGIEASRQIISNSPNAVILVITAYDDFNYIQQSLEIGIRGFILKPIKDEEIIENINKCIELINAKNSNVDVNNKIEKAIEVVKPLIQKEIISALKSGNFDKTELEYYIGFLHEKLEAGFFMLISYEQIFSNQMKDIIREDISKEKINEIILEFIPLSRKCFIGEKTGNFQTVFFLVEKGYTEKDILEEALKIAYNLKRKIKVMIDVDVRFGIGRVYTGIHNMKRSYNEAYFSLSKTNSKVEVIHYENLHNDILPSSFHYPFKLENEMMGYIRSGDSELAKKTAYAVVLEISNNCTSIELAKEYASQLISMIKRSLLLYGTEVKILDGSFSTAEINKVVDIKELEGFCRNHILHLIDSVMEFKQRGKDAVIASMVKEYIDRHYFRDITLESVAEDVGLGSSYISRIFKEELGGKFIDYIIDKRINLAKDMILAGEKNIKKIAESAGYHDVNYFCRVFKKYTGLTTGQFRLNNSKIANELIDN